MVHLVKAMVSPVVIMDDRVGPQRKLSAEELMILNCGVGGINSSPQVYILENRKSNYC